MCHLFGLGEVRGGGCVVARVQSGLRCPEACVAHLQQETVRERGRELTMRSDHFLADMIQDTHGSNTVRCECHLLRRAAEVTHARQVLERGVVAPLVQEVAQLG